VGKDNVYMREEIKRVHKTNRDWQHNVGESSETMSDDEEGTWTTTTMVTSTASKSRT
jgi:hypothetical protein